jgi:hypothetical protein
VGNLASALKYSSHMFSLQSVHGRTSLEGYRLQRACYLSRVNHDGKIRSRKQRIEIGKYYFVNRIIQLWNQLPADASGTLSCNQVILGKRLGKS